LTLHAAKGLEFSVVFIVGLEEGLFPHARSMGEPEEMEEERRLLYVGVTRAKDQLILLHTFRRTLYGESDLREPSRFLRDIPGHLIKGREDRKDTREAQSHARSGHLPGQGQRPAFTQPRRDMPTLSPTAAPPRQDAPALSTTAARLRFHTGDEVEHQVFGKGVVVESRMSGGDEQVTVAFAGAGLKRLIASLAPMDKVANRSTL
jgi:DNA helicase-2/ATP-dependent DNA helicase PcrA